MPKRELYQLEIAPLTVVSIKRSPFFSYGSLEPVPQGSLVHIPFGRRMLRGVVFQCRPFAGKMPVWMKMVVRVERSRFLTPDQCSLALFLSHTYFTPLGNCLKHFLVPQLKRPFKEKKAEKEKKILPRLSKEKEKVLERLLKKTRVPKLYLSGKRTDERDLLFHYLSQKLQAEKTVLLLVPELLLALWWKEELEPYFGESLALLHSKVRGSELGSLWEDIRSGRKRLILGTRQALFAPFPSLETILVTDEEDMTSYKQWEMSPRFTVQGVARELARLKRSEIILVSPTPGLPSLFANERGKVRLIEEKGLAEERSRVTLINLRFEKKRRESLSQSLTESIAKVLQQKKKVLLLGKQSGLSPLSLCDKCRTVVRCPQCENVLVSLKAGHFRCRNCSYKTNVFPVCRKCGAMTFKSFGAGTEKIEKDTHMRFPEARILRIDHETLEKRVSLETTVGILRSGKFDVVVGTYGATKLPNLPSLSLVAMIEADSHLAFPDYQAKEKLLRDIERCRILAGGEKEGLLVLQTFEPELSFFKDGIQTPYLLEAQELLRERKVRGYPPEVRFLKVECPASNPSQSQKRALELTTDLILLIQKEKIQASLILPHLPLALAKQKHYQFFIRFPSTLPFSPILHNWCEKKAFDCLFDLDPMTLT